ncbi:MAG: serine hydrolase [Rhodospirillales bacterium]
MQANIVVDYESGRVIHETNADRQTYPASLTKMMTLYMVFEAMEQNRLKLGERLPVSAYAAGRAPTKLGLTAGETIMLQHAILGVVTKSANDAAAVIAERLGGTEARFAELMTDRAHQLGMHDTAFRNASGLPHRSQVTTARDMAILSVALLRDFPQYYKFFATDSFTYKGVTHNNHNHLKERYEGMDGIKTGFINASGFNLAASVERNGRRLVAVVMGGASARSRDAFMENLLDANYARMARPDQARTVLASAESLLPPTPADPRPKIIRVAAADKPETPHLEAGIGSAAIAGLAKSEIAALNRLARKVAANDEPAPRAARSSQWAVQLATFTTKGAAHQAIAKAERAMPALKRSPGTVQTARINKKTVYKAKFAGLSEEAARQACVKLKPMATCTVMPAEGFAQSASNPN